MAEVYETRAERLVGARRLSNSAIALSSGRGSRGETCVQATPTGCEVEVFDDSETIHENLTVGDSDRYEVPVAVSASGNGEVGHARNGSGY